MLMPLKIPLLSGNVSVLIIYFFNQRKELMPTFIVLVNFQLLEESLKAKQSKKQICRNSYGTNELRTRRVYRILSHSFTLLLKNINFLFFALFYTRSVFNICTKIILYIKINIECFEVNIKAGVVVLIIQIYFI